MANTSYPILLCNGGENKNMCSLNSVLQLLGNIQEFCAQVQEWKNTSLLIVLDLVSKRRKANKMRCICRFKPDGQVITISKGIKGETVNVKQ